MRWAIWYYLYNLKNVKNTHGGVLILCNVTKINTPPWVFLTFVKLCKWCQIVQRIIYVNFLASSLSESAKLRKLHAKNVLTCQLALRAYVFTCQRALRA